MKLKSLMCAAMLAAPLALGACAASPLGPGMVMFAPVNETAAPGESVNVPNGIRIGLANAADWPASQTLVVSQARPRLGSFARDYTVRNSQTGEEKLCSGTINYSSDGFVSINCADS